MSTESDLRTLRDHARVMVDADHRPDCAWATWHAMSPRERHWSTIPAPAKCAGCVTPDDRALWRQLADEATGRVGA